MASIPPVVGDRGEQDGGLGPARGAGGARRRRPGHVDLVDHEARCDRRDRRRDPRRPGDADDPRTVGAHAGCDRRTLRTAPHHVLTCVQHPDGPAVLVGETPGDVADLGRRLPTEGPAVAERTGGLATRLAPRRIGFEVRRLDPRGLQRAHPGAGRQLDRRPHRRSRAASLDLAAQLACVRQRLADHPFAAGVEEGDERARRCGVVGEPAPPERHVSPHVLPDPTLQPSPHHRICLLQTSGGQSEADRTAERWGASRCSGRGGRGGTGGRRLRWVR